MEAAAVAAAQEAAAEESGAFVPFEIEEKINNILLTTESQLIANSEIDENTKESVIAGKAKTLKA